MNAYITLREHRHGTGHVHYYELVLTAGHNSHIVIQLSPDESRALIRAGVPITTD